MEHQLKAYQKLVTILLEKLFSYMYVYQLMRDNKINQLIVLLKNKSTCIDRIPLAMSIAIFTLRLLLTD